MQVAGNSVTVVVLNARYSEVQAQVLVNHVPCVIGMSNLIDDDAAITYAESFYNAIASGRSVANAHQQGVTALMLAAVSGQTRDVSSVVTAPRMVPRLLTRLDADRIYIVPRTKQRCVLVIQATLEDFDPEVVARITEQLRQWTGDLSLRITDVEDLALLVAILEKLVREDKNLRTNSGSLSSTP